MPGSFSMGIGYSSMADKIVSLIDAPGENKKEEEI
jgi:hypothetical protein